MTSFLDYFILILYNAYLLIYFTMLPRSPQLSINDFEPEDDKNEGSGESRIEAVKNFLVRHRGLLAGVLGAIALSVVGYRCLKPQKPGSELMSEYSSIPAQDKEYSAGLKYPDFGARQLKVVEWTNDGYITRDSENFVSVEVTGKNGTKVSYEMMAHELRWGNSESYYMLPLDGPHALAACKVLGYDLPTRWMQMGLRHKIFQEGGKQWFIAHPEIFESLGRKSEAGKRNGLFSKNGPEDMETPQVIQERGNLFMKMVKKSNLDPSKPISGHIKEVIQDPMQAYRNLLATFPGCEGKGLAKGWQTSPNLGCGLVAEVHPTRFFDYSHGVRCAKPEIEVNGTDMSLADFYANKNYRAEFDLGGLPLRVPAYDYPPALAKWMEEHGYKVEPTPKSAPGGKGKKKHRWRK